MAAQTKNEYTPNPEPTVNDAVAAIAAAFQQTLATVAPKKVTMAQLRPKTPFNPEAKTGRKLVRATYQNGTKLNPTFLTDREIALVNQLKPGKFVGGLVRVVERDHGPDKEIHILYENKTAEQRIALKDQARNFTDILTQCVEGAAQ
jgi:hypothetical protein